MSWYVTEFEDGSVGCFRDSPELPSHVDSGSVRRAAVQVKEVMALDDVDGAKDLKSLMEEIRASAHFGDWAIVIHADQNETGIVRMQVAYVFDSETMGDGEAVRLMAESHTETALAHMEEINGFLSGLDPERN